jgi:hypothetical protein
MKSTISSEGLPCKQNEHLIWMTKIFNKIVVTENIASNQEGPFKEVKREIQG